MLLPVLHCNFFQSLDVLCVLAAASRAHIELRDPSGYSFHHGTKGQQKRLPTLGYRPDMEHRDKGQGHWQPRDRESGRRGRRVPHRHSPPLSRGRRRMVHQTCRGMPGSRSCGSGTNGPSSSGSPSWEGHSVRGERPNEDGLAPAHQASLDEAAQALDVTQGRHGPEVLQEHLVTLLGHLSNDAAVDAWQRAAVYAGNVVKICTITLYIRV